VLGNLPHSRPGRRSEKRGAGRPAAAAGAAAEKAEAADSAAAKTPRAGRAARPRKPAAARPKRGRRAPPAAPPPEPRSRGPVEDAVQLAGRIAGTGLRVVGGITKEVLRRLPRP
jgi:hypothetical protein